MAAFRIHYGVARAQGSRDYQEDEYTCLDNLSTGAGPALFCVYDGHGGDNVSADASNRLHNTILSSNLMDPNIDQVIAAAFQQEDNHLTKFMSKLRSDRAGCTATVAVVSTQKIHLGNVGDSRAVLGILDDKGTLQAHRLSKDHHLEDPAESQRVLAAGGAVFQGRIYSDESAINMTRALGDMAFKTPLNKASKDFISAKPYICPPVDITPKCQFMVVASDGLWNEIDNDLQVVQRIEAARQQGQSPEAIAKGLADHCAKAPYSDNVTVIVVLFNWGGQPTPTQGAAPPGTLLISEHKDATVIL